MHKHNQLIHILVVLSLILSGASPALAAAGPVVVVTPTVTPSATPSATPSKTAAPTAETPTLTPTPAPTASETPAPTPAPVIGQPGLSLSAAPSAVPSATPGASLLLAWSITNLPDLSSAILALQLPKGLSPNDPQGYDPTTGLVLLKSPSPTGEVSLSAAPDAGGPLQLSATLWVAEKEAASASLTLEAENFTQVKPAGGSVQGLGGKVSVSFPAAALDKLVDESGLRVHIQDASSQASLGGMPFEITAQQQLGDALLEVNRFSQPITITVAFPKTMPDAAAASLKLFYFDESQQTWRPLTTQVDTQRGLLVAQSDHLTLFDFQAQNWEAARLPSLQGFQVSAFTGSSGYSFGFQLPPAPPGLQPSLSLSYNSQLVDGASARTQAGYAGMGWSLNGESYIQRSMNGTPGYFGDDTFSLQAGGVGGSLLPIADQDGNPNTIDYRLAEDNFWRIRQNLSSGTVGGYPGDTSSWEAWDQTGSHYTFNPDGYYPAYPNGCASIVMKPWRWSLSVLRSVANQELTYTYAYENAPSPKFDEGCSGYQANMAVAIYPDEIRYPGGHYRVKLLRTTRSDYDSAWNDSQSTMLYQRSLLSAVQVWHDPDGVSSSGDEQLVRQYSLGYAENSQQIYPALTWPGGGKTPTLTSIREIGADGVSSLPATSFSYADGMHLSLGTNGSGGQAGFSYSAWNVEYDLSSTTDRPDAQRCEPPTWTGATQGQNRYFNEILGGYCANLDSYRNYFQPGGVYRLRTLLNYLSGEAGTFQIGLDTGATGILWKDAISFGYDQVNEFTFTIPAGASQLRPLYRCWKSSDPNNAHSCQLKIFTMAPLLTRYQVSAKSLSDGVSGNVSTTLYRYNGAALNDAAHSTLVANTAADRRHLVANSEYRGSSLVEEIGPDGVVNASLFYQDDNRRGQASSTWTGTQSLADNFATLNGSYWSAAGAAVELVNGDAALKLDNPSANWNTWLQRSSASLSSGKSVIVQFRLRDAVNAQLALALETGSGSYQRWGLKAKNSGLYGYRCTTNNDNACSDQAAPFATGVISNTWYVALLALDDSGGFLVRTWARDNPDSSLQEYRESLSGFSGSTWKFLAKLNAGSAWLDGYREGRLLSLSQSLYSTSGGPSVSPLPCKDTDGDKECNLDYLDYAITWTRLDSQASYTFEQSSQWAGTRSSREYDAASQGGTQYGNLTRVVEAAWNGSSYVAYRTSRTLYYPFTSNSRYLVGLPGSSSSYFCDSNGNCPDTDSELTGQTLYLYDGHTAHDAAPSQGLLTGQRSLLEKVSGVQRYRDEQYGYDSYGNRTSTSAYPADSPAGSPFQGTAQVSLTCYGAFTWSSGACASDGYRTYAQGATNALGQNTATAYDKRLGVPTSVTDANNVTTSAEYDGFGRITKVIRPGDDTNSPSMQMVYYDAWQPMMVEVWQRIEGTLYYSQRKFYNGLGQLLQAQTPRAELSGATRDIIVDYQYDLNGRLVKQTVPYTNTAWTSGMGGTPWHTQDFSKPHTLTSYDLFGRPWKTSAPDGAVTETTYGTGTEAGAAYAWSKVKDPNGNVTETRQDAWGRTSKVLPPTGPGVSYVYKTNDALEHVIRGTAAISMTYDLAGRKTQMADPDLGAWSYTYNALGSLTSQTDARGCATSLSYDLLNRLTGKSYGGAGCGAATSPVSYLYDGVLRQDTFNDNALPTGWTMYNATFSGGKALVPPGAAWANNLHRTGTVYDGQGCEITFSVDSAQANGAMYLSSGAWGNANYRRWGLYWSGGVFYRETVVGTTGSQTAVGMAVAANAVYKLRLEVDGLGTFKLTLQRLTPTIAQVSLSEAHTTWNDLVWTYTIQSHLGTTSLDEYKEILSANGLGQRTGMMDGSGNTAWSYDNRGRLTLENKAVIGAGSFVSQWNYNSANLVSWMKYPADNAGNIGEQVNSYYNNRMLLDNTYSPTNSYQYLLDTQYDAAGRATLRWLGGVYQANTPVLAQSYAYHDWATQGGRLRLLETKNAQNSTYQSLAYTYDAAGSILSILDGANSGQKQCFSYDQLKRLTGAKVGFDNAACSGTLGNGEYADETYGYDSLTGNLSSKTGMGNITYDATHKHAVASTSTGWSYQYDANGSLTRRDPPGTDYYDYTYDAESRLVQAKKNGSLIASLVYDGDGKRVEAVQGSTTTVFVGSYFEWNVTAGTMVKYYQAGGQTVAIRTGAGSGTAGLRFTLSDHLGSTSLSINADLSGRADQLYKPWGESRYAAGTLGTKYTYTGQYSYATSAANDFGLMDYNARFYDPQLGRFASPDSLIPQSTQGVQAWDRYGYVNNSP